MKYSLTIIALALCSLLTAQRNYTLSLKAGNVTPSANFSTVLLQRAAIDPNELIEHAYFVRIIQFEEIPLQEHREAMEALGLVFHGYVDFGAYITLVPNNFDLTEIAKYGVRSIMPFEPAWKIQPQVLQAEQRPWAIDGDWIDVAMHYLPKADVELTMMRLQNVGGVKRLRIDDDYLRAQIHRSKLFEIAALPELLFIELIQAPGQPEDQNGKSIHRSHVLDNQSGIGPRFTGNGVGVQVRDDGALGPHIDYQGRLTNISTTFGDSHGDGVGGIMAGAGNLNPDNRGMAAGATVFATNYNSTFTDNTLNLHQTQGVMITNSSYSDGCNDGYTTSTRTVDNQIFQNNTLMHVFSGGNANPQDCGYGAGTNWGNITGGHKQGKNCIATANLDANSAIASSSSRGPAHDGRIKPDISAHGQGQVSTNENNTYQNFGGTSGAAPGIAGCMAQLYEAYRTLNNGTTPESALIKAALLNTANDLGNKGPDYTFGWGVVNAGRAYKLIESNRFNTGTIAQGQTQTQNITMPANVREARIMLYWAEPAAAINATRALINDLDLRLLNSSNVASLPYRLNSAPNATTLAQPAGTGRDSLNNMEQVALQNPAAGSTWTIEIKGKAVPMGPQKYWIVIEYVLDEITVIFPNGGEGLVPGTTQRIVWDASEGTANFALSYSSDGGTNWTSITNTAPAVSRQFTWTVPTVQSGRMKIRVARGTQSDISDTLFTTTSLVTGVAITKVCPQEATVEWRRHAQATHYEVFKLGTKYMESVGVTTDTTLSFAHAFNPNAPLWVSVRPILQSIYPGRRINAISQANLTACSNITDLSQVSIQSPLAGTIKACEAFDIPVEIRLKNESINTLTGATAYYSYGPQVVAEPLPTINGSATINYVFNQPILANQNQNFQLRTWISHPNDQIRFNDSLSVNFSVVLAATGTLAAQTFDGGVPPASWSLENVDNGLTWVQENIATQSNGQLGATARINFFSYNARGQLDKLSSPPFVVASSGTPRLTFDRAHALYNTTYNDGLRIEVAPNCGNSGAPVQVYEKFGAALATTTPQTTNFIPNSANQWLRDTIDLSAFKGDTVIISFVSVNDFGNSLYIDNINLEQTLVAAPTAQIQILQSATCVNNPITFQAAQGSNMSTTYSWVASDGAQFSGVGPHTAQPSQAGTYTITLTATNAGGTNSATQTIQLQAATSAAYTTATTGYTVQFASTSINATSYLWNFGDGNSSTSQNPVHTYAANGTYTATLIATGPCGQSQTSQGILINVGQPPTAQIQINANQICAGQSVNLIAANSIVGTNYAWSFSGGTPTQNGTTGSALTVPFNQAGQFTITLTASNALGTATDQVNVTVLSGPSAAFAVGVNQYNATFTNNSSNATSWLWNFGDGATSIDANPSHTYATNGNYQVTLVATGTCGSTSTAQTVVIAVVQAPTLVWSVSRDSACVFDQLVFQAAPSANTPANISWNFDIGAQPSVTATGAGQQTVWYNQPGTYTVTIIASNVAGADTVTQVLYILPPPTADFNSSVSGYAAQFTNLTQAGQSYSWAFGDGGTSTLSSPNHTYTAPGTYQVTLTATGRCGTDQVIWPVVIENQNPPNVQITQQVNSVCANAAFQVAATAPLADDVFWYLDQIAGAPIASGFGPLDLSIASAGAHIVYAVASNANGSDTASFPIQIIGLPSVQLGQAVIQNMVAFNATVSADATTWFWDFGDGSPTVQDLITSHQYITNGNFTATFTATNQCGATAQDILVTIAVSAPSATIVIPTDTVCVNESLDVSALLPPDVLITNWSWDFDVSASPGTAIGNGPHTVTWSSPGTKTIKLTVSNQGGSNTIERMVVVVAPATSTFNFTAQQLTVSFENTSVGGNSYLWDFGDGNTSTAFSPTHTYASNGTYPVNLTVTNACGLSGSINTSVTVLSVGSDNPTWLKSAILYPNPATQVVHLAIDANLTPAPAQLEIWNSEGRLIEASRLDLIQGSQLLTHFVGQLASGRYVVVLHTVNGRWVSEFVKE